MTLLRHSCLVVATHPDDEVLGCGGTIAKYARAGHDVAVVVVTSGLAELYPPEEDETIRAELAEAHALLGVKETHFLGFPAPALDTVPFWRLASALADLIGRVRPETVFIPHHGDLHDDHQYTYRACLVASRPAGGVRVSRVLAYETLSETDWAPARQDQAFVPTVYEDISPFIDDKLRAMACYASQVRPAPGNRCPESLKALARVRGGAVYVDYAEAFQLVREIR